MAKTTAVWTGLEEYRAQLRAMPRECVNEAARIVEGAANAAYVKVSTVYGNHRYTGRLQDRLKIVTINAGELRTGKDLRSNAPHAWLFDNGTQARHWKSGKSTGKMWGHTPPTHIFVRTVVAERRRATQKLKDMVLRHGASTVTET